MFTIIRGVFFLSNLAILICILTYCNARVIFDEITGKCKTVVKHQRKSAEEIDGFRKHYNLHNCQSIFIGIVYLSIIGIYESFKNSCNLL